MRTKILGQILRVTAVTLVAGFLAGCANSQCCSGDRSGQGSGRRASARGTMDSGPVPDITNRSYGNSGYR